MKSVNLTKSNVIEFFKQQYSSKNSNQSKFIFGSKLSNLLYKEAL